MLLESLQTLLIQRTLEPMTTVGMDVTTVATSNADLAEPIYSALLTIGLVDIVYPPSDTDLSNITLPLDILKLVDLSYLYLLRTIVNRMTAVDERLGPHGVWASQYPDRIMKVYNYTLTELSKKYGIGLSTLEAGLLSFEFVSEIE